MWNFSLSRELERLERVHAERTKYILDEQEYNAAHSLFADSAYLAKGSPQTDFPGAVDLTDLTEKEKKEDLEWYNKEFEKHPYDPKGTKKRLADFNNRNWKNRREWKKVKGRSDDFREAVDYGYGRYNTSAGGDLSREERTMYSILGNLGTSSRKVGTTAEVVSATTRGQYFHRKIAPAGWEDKPVYKEPTQPIKRATLAKATGGKEDKPIKEIMMPNGKKMKKATFIEKYSKSAWERATKGH